MNDLFVAISVGLAVLIQATPAAARPEISAPFPEEAAILHRIEKGPSPLLHAELAGVRARHAATCYERWQASGKSVDLQQAIFYAASAAELSPQWDRPRVLLGMIYASFHGDQEALELAAEVLIEAIDINPANGPAQLLLAQVLMNQGRFWSAIEQYQGLFAKNAAMITPMNTAPLALCYILDNRMRAGVIYFDRLAAERPGHPAVAVGRAVLLKHAGEPGRAGEILANLASSAEAGPELRQYARDLKTSWDKEAGP